MANELHRVHGDTPRGPSDNPAYKGMLPVSRSRLPPWILILLAGFAFCLLFAGIMGVAALVQPVKRASARGLQEQAMPDGTILVLEKVTVGTAHRVEWVRPRTFADWLGGRWAGNYSANAHAPGDSIMVWISRRDPATGACLDVDWWLRSAAVGDYGAEIDDDHAGRDSFTANGSSGLSGSRPFGAQPPGQYELIVAHSAIPPFRHSGNSFKLRVYDVKNEVVAEFDVPHSAPATLPAWTVDALPATKTVDGLDVTLIVQQPKKVEFYVAPPRIER